jgi:hypothetical protein
MVMVQPYLIADFEKSLLPWIQLQNCRLGAHRFASLNQGE